MGHKHGHDLLPKYNAQLRNITPDLTGQALDRSLQLFSRVELPKGHPNAWVLKPPKDSTLKMKAWDLESLPGVSTKRMDQGPLRFSRAHESPTEIRSNSRENTKNETKDGQASELFGLEVSHSPYTLD